MSEHIVIVTGSASLSKRALADISHDAIVIGVDGGLDVALAADVAPSELIGDLDSVSGHGLDWAESHATITRHPAEKDETDTELALAHAADMHPDRLTMLGGGDRLDHTIAALGALAARHLTGVPILDTWWNDQHVDVIHGPGRRTLRLEPGSTLSLLAIGPACDKVAVSGVRWPLHDHRLDPVVGLGVSNEVTDPGGEVRVSVSAGVLTVFDVPIQTGTESDHPPIHQQGVVSS